MDYIKKLTIGAVMAAFVLPISSVQVSGHETRLVGPNDEYTVVVGFENEPAFEDEINGAVIIVRRTSDNKPINTSLETPDVVDLELEVQFRAEETFDSEILALKMLEKPGLGFGEENRYDTVYRPTHDGTHAFRFTGIIADNSDPQAGQISIDETFVCGEGKLGARSFGCVKDSTTFPSDSVRIRGNDVDLDSYRDNDKF